MIPGGGAVRERGWRGGLAALWAHGLAAWREGRAQPSPTADWLAFGVVAAALLLAAAAIMVGSPVQPTKQFEEGGVVTVATSMLLSASAALALAAFYVRARDRDIHALFWLLAAAGLAFLALDEQLQFHERVGDYISDKYGDSGPFRNWNDLIVILYGFAAAGFGLLFLPEVVRHARMVEFLGIGFFFYVLHTAIDSLAKTATPLSIVGEESAKLVAIAFIAAAIAAGLMSVVDRAIERR